MANEPKVHNYALGLVSVPDGFDIIEQQVIVKQELPLDAASQQEVPVELGDTSVPFTVQEGAVVTVTHRYKNGLGKYSNSHSVTFKAGEPLQPPTPQPFVVVCQDATPNP